MKYEKCLTCSQLGVSCDGPNFLAMDTTEIGLWFNMKRKQVPGMTYDKIAAETGISKSAVHGFLNGKHADYRLETIRPIAKLITGGKWDDNPCGNLSNVERDQYDQKTQQLEADVKWRDDKINHLLYQVKTLQDDQDFFKEQIRSKNKFLTALGIALSLAVSIIIIVLIIDRINPNIGFFWVNR